ncbi:outer membrane insertion C- signal [Fabibacter sp. E12]|nr:outer membrane insertion C- signal [Roseivirga sp. E12]
MTLVLMSALFTQVKGQELGIRFGNGTVGDVALDAVFSLGEFSRVHANLSFGDDQVGVDALVDFIYKPFGPENFNWYAGAGPFVGLGDDFQLGAVGEIGLEYHFDEVPLALGLDWRPAFRLVDDTDFTVEGFGFNLRFVF